MAGADAELGVHLAQVPFDRARGQEQLRADLRVRQAGAGQPGDLLLLRRELVARIGVSLSHLLARGDQFPARALGERLHAHRCELIMGGTELGARVDAPLPAAQPLPVQQMGAGELRTQPGPAQPADRLAVQAVGGRRVAQQRAAAGLDAQGGIGPAGLGRFRQPRKRVAGEPGV